MLRLHLYSSYMAVQSLSWTCIDNTAAAMVLHCSCCSKRGTWLVCASPAAGIMFLKCHVSRSSTPTALADVHPTRQGVGACCASGPQVCCGKTQRGLLAADLPAEHLLRSNLPSTLYHHQRHRSLAFLTEIICNYCDRSVWF